MFTKKEASWEHPVKEWEPLGSVLLCGDVGDVAVAGQEEDHMAAGAVLETLEQQVLGLELVEPVGVHDEDEVVDDVSEAGAGQQEPPAVGVRPGTREQGVDHLGYRLKLEIRS